MIAEADRLTPHNRFDVQTVAAGHYPTSGKLAQIAGILDTLA